MVTRNKSKDLTHDNPLSSALCKFPEPRIKTIKLLTLKHLFAWPKSKNPIYEIKLCQCSTRTLTKADRQSRYFSDVISWHQDSSPAVENQAGSFIWPIKNRLQRQPLLVTAAGGGKKMCYCMLPGSLLKHKNNMSLLSFDKTKRQRCFID